MVVLKLPTYSNYQLVKQKPCRLCPEWTLQIEEEVEKLLEADFWMSVSYPQWMANIVSIPKKVGKVQMYINFWELNKVFSKDDFFFPDFLIDSMAGHEMMSFMNRFSRYNQIIIERCL